MIKEELEVDEEEEAARMEAEGKTEAEPDDEKAATRERSGRKKRRRINQIKKQLRKFFDKKTYEKAVIAWGSWKAKVFYGV